MLPEILIQNKRCDLQKPQWITGPLKNFTQRQIFY